MNPCTKVHLSLNDPRPSRRRTTLETSHALAFEGKSKSLNEAMLVLSWPRSLHSPSPYTARCVFLAGVCCCVRCGSSFTGHESKCTNHAYRAAAKILIGEGQHKLSCVFPTGCGGRLILFCITHLRLGGFGEEGFGIISPGVGLWRFCRLISRER